MENADMHFTSFIQPTSTPRLKDVVFKGAREIKREQSQKECEKTGHILDIFSELAFP